MNKFPSIAIGEPKLDFYHMANQVKKSVHSFPRVQTAENIWKDTNAYLVTSNKPSLTNLLRADSC